MASALSASLIELMFGLKLGHLAQDPSNRLSFEGLAVSPRPDGALDIGAGKFEAASLRLTSGPLMLEVGRLALHQLAAQVRMEAGQPLLDALELATAELSAVRVQSPLTLTPPPKEGSHGSHAPRSARASGAGSHEPPRDSWDLGPLAAADGTLRAEIVDAHLLFDADVTVPVRHGRVDFNQATVEHVGPDSRMGVSRLGLYVDAPNGRSYLYQFPSALVAGVEYERRGALPGPWVADRGKLLLQPFGEGLLRQGTGGHGLGFTEQARLLFDRTAVSGDLQLGDGRFAAPGVHADLTGRAQARNLIRVHSEAVGRGLTIEMASLSIRNAALFSTGTQLHCDELSGAVMLRVFVENGQLRVELNVPRLALTGVRVPPRQG